ncbi:MAG: class I SAM-dependent methyltransferase [Candidatus Goldiibacteriota bacterium]
MDKRYWDGKAERYEKEIFSSYGEDKKGIIRKHIKKFGSKKRNALDLGCGIGIYSKMLSAGFGKVYSYDISGELIAKAEKNNSRMKNVFYGVKDLSADVSDIPKADFAVCANVLITKCYETRSRMLKNINMLLEEKGNILFVLPSAESALYSNYMLFEWNLAEGLGQNEAIRKGMKAEHESEEASVSDGLIKIDGITTKHYLKEEIEHYFPKYNFKVKKIEKIEYSWETEFESPPSWMGEPLPWDWMVLCGKRRR